MNLPSRKFRKDVERQKNHPDVSRDGEKEEQNLLEVVFDEVINQVSPAVT